MGRKLQTPNVQPSGVEGFDKVLEILSDEDISLVKPVAIVATVDWLTLTAKTTQAKTELFKASTEVLADVRKNGGNVKNWSFKGYNGYNAEGFRWGTRSDSDIAMLSGQDAEELWKVFLPIAENVTRVDLAVTVETSNPIPGLLEYYYEWDQETHRRSLSTHRLTATLIKNNKGGQTLYVGARCSNQLGRVYDKAAEQQMPEFIGRLWRYEVEFKRERARAVATRLVDHNHLHNQIKENIRSTVFLWFDARDVPPIFHHTGQEFSLEIEAKVQSDEISLNWLSSQVKPTVQRLLKKGKATEVYESLGIYLDSKCDSMVNWD